MKNKIKNIRKNGVENAKELEEILKQENPEYYALFQQVKQSVSDWVIDMFWNALAKTEIISETQEVGEKLSALGFGTALGVVISYMGNPEGLGLAGLVGSFAGLNFSLIGGALSGPTVLTAKDKKLLEIESMVVMYPDLYDIELIFNRADLEAVKQSIAETGYDGKQIYIEANKKWEKYWEKNKFKRPSTLKKANTFIEHPEDQPEK